MMLFMAARFMINHLIKAIKIILTCNEQKQCDQLPGSLFSLANSSL
jgi:hypothetical protein